MSFVDLTGPAGRLEALYSRHEHARAAALVCHPHPPMGGTMHNHVTYRVAQAFASAGCSALRFNFRGVGRSSGTHDEGRGEVDDAAAALEFLAKDQPGVPLVAAGFSFGSRVALELTSREPRVAKALAVGLPLSLYDFGFVRALRRPLAIVQADRDQFGALDEVRRLAESLPFPCRVFVVQDCDHLATGRLDAFAATAREAVAWLLDTG
ncbi:MAG: alpha/beta hydrolase [Myxococcaceae bacterium]